MIVLRQKEYFNLGLMGKGLKLAAKGGKKLIKSGGKWLKHRFVKTPGKTTAATLGTLKNSMKGGLQKMWQGAKTTVGGLFKNPVSTAAVAGGGLYLAGRNGDNASIQSNGADQEAVQQATVAPEVQPTQPQQPVQNNEENGVQPTQPQQSVQPTQPVTPAQSTPAQPTQPTQSSDKASQEAIEAAKKEAKIDGYIKPISDSNALKANQPKINAGLNKPAASTTTTEPKPISVSEAKSNLKAAQEQAKQNDPVQKAKQDLRDARKNARQQRQAASLQRRINNANNRAANLQNRLDSMKSY